MNSIIKIIKDKLKMFYSGCEFDGIELTLMIIISILAIGIFAFYGSYQLFGVGLHKASGSSMEPVMEDGCNAVLIESHLKQDGLKNKVAIINIRNQPIMHQIIYVDESYDPETSKYYIDNRGYFVKNINGEDYIISKNPYQSPEYMDKVEGKTIVVTKGVNNHTNPYPDPAIISNNNIIGIVDTNHIYSIPKFLC